MAVYYRRCPACGFLFTDAFDDWSVDQFKTHIYNDDYHLFDPDYLIKRPSHNAGMLRTFGPVIKPACGCSISAAAMTYFAQHFAPAVFREAVTYDPMVPEHAGRPEGKFDLVTCFETLEHLPDPLAGIAAIADCVAEPGAVFYSTLTQPADFDNRGLSWWYVGPRNGHISIFTKQALAMAWARYGFKTAALERRPPSGVPHVARELGHGGAYQLARLMSPPD